MSYFQNIEDCFTEREARFAVYVRPISRNGKMYVGVYKGAKDDPDSVAGKVYTLKSSDRKKVDALALKLKGDTTAEICVCHNELFINTQPTVSSHESRRLNKLLNGMQIGENDSVPGSPDLLNQGHTILA